MHAKKDQPSSLNGFEQFGLSPSTLAALKTKGFESPTPIQILTIPALLSGEKDLIGQAQTGTGKTAAFALPLIDLLKENKGTVQALILTPTRELALQVATEIESLRGSKRLSVLPVYGGQSITVQLKQLRKPVDVIVGTPGRVIDHLERGTLEIDALSHLILDEADEMLNRGFLPDIEKILQQTPSNKQTMLFSATMPAAILKVAEKYMREYNLIKAARSEVACATIEQYYFKIDHKDRFIALCRIIDSEAPFYGVIFCRTKRDTEHLSRRLSELGYSADALNGDMSQNAREKILGKFKSRIITILVATDVAARGIDIKNVSHVINYALPEEPETYVHRIGRTGRAGMSGKALSLVTPAQKQALKTIERSTGFKIHEAPLPTVEKIVAQKRKTIIDELTKSLEKKPQNYYLEIAQELLDKHEAATIVALLLKRTFNTQLKQENTIAQEKPAHKGTAHSAEKRPKKQRAFFTKKRTKRLKGEGFQKKRSRR